MTNRFDTGPAATRFLLRNTPFVYVQHFVTFGSSIIVTLLLPRFLGPALFGAVFLAEAIRQIFGTGVEFGGQHIIPDEIGRTRGGVSRIVAQAVASRVLIALACVGGIAFLTYSHEYSTTQRTIILIYATQLLWHAPLLVLQAAYRGIERTAYVSVALMVERVFQATAVVAIAISDASAVLLAALLVTGSAIQLAMLWRFFPGIFSGIPRINWRDVFRLRDALPYFLLAAFAALNARIDTVILSLLTSDEVVGWYGGACRLLDAVNIPYILPMVVLPVLVHTGKTEHGDLPIQRRLELMMVYGIPVAVTAIACAEPLIGLIYGLDGYSGSVLPFRILSGGLPVLFIDTVLGAYLVRSGRRRNIIVIAFSAVILAAGLNVILIPPFDELMGNGGVGAAIATTLTEVLIMISLVSTTPKEDLAGFRWRQFARVAGASLAMGCVLFLFQLLVIPWYLNASLSLISCCLLLKLLGAFDSTERALLRTLGPHAGRQQFLAQW